MRTLLNLADTIKAFAHSDMPPYSCKLWEEGSVIHCPLRFDPTADTYNQTLIKALKELPSHPAPYGVHCMEGKDRTGYVCAQAFSSFLLSHGMSQQQLDALVYALTTPM